MHNSIIKMRKIKFIFIVFIICYHSSAIRAQCAPDTQAPTIICPGNIIYAFTDSNSCDAAVSNLTPIFEDNCGVESLTWSMTMASNGSSAVTGINDISGTIFNKDTTTVIYVVTDSVGLSASCSFLVVVEDSIPPAITYCPDSLIEIVANQITCDYTLTASDENLLRPQFTNNCSLSAILERLNITPNGQTVQTYVNPTLTGLTLAVGDNAFFWEIEDTLGYSTNNSSYCSYTVRILDTIFPAITCPPDVNQYIDPESTAGSVISAFPVITDNCVYESEINDFNFTSDASDMYPLGVTLVSWSVVDISGNASTCTQSIEILPSDCSTLNVTKLTTPASCFGSYDGAIDLTASGGIAPYSFYWNNGQNTEDLGNLNAGNYTVLVVDEAGCDTTLSIFITQPQEIDLTINTTDATCGNQNGSAEVIINSGGTAPFNYSWTACDGTNSIANLSAGLYSVEITDSDGCTSASTFNIADSDGPSIVADLISGPSCVGYMDGFISITAAGGAGGYSYNWQHGPVVDDISLLAQGNYILTVTDANGCEVSESFELIDPLPLDLSDATISNTDCFLSTGEIILNPTGGAGGYTFEWDQGGNTNSISNLITGLYGVIVSDINGCSERGKYIINALDGPQVAENYIVKPTCMNNDGAINVDVTGGVEPYEYLWFAGYSVKNISALSVGNYELVVTDANGCQGYYYHELMEADPIPQDICLVTVDTSSNTNVVVWSKMDTNLISHYNIYRQVGGILNLVGQKSVALLSNWEDLNADPSEQSSSYLISEVDSCGRESFLSPIHKTIHLNACIDTEVNLSWDYYNGFEYDSVYISRYHPSTGWENIAVIDGILNTYIDANAPGMDNLEYLVEVTSPDICTAAKAQDYNSSRSNKARGEMNPNTGGLLVNLNPSVSIFPNPVTHIFNISSTQPIYSSFYINDVQGRVVQVGKMAGENCSVDISKLSKGMYAIVFEQDDLPNLSVVKE